MSRNYFRSAAEYESHTKNAAEYESHTNDSDDTAESKSQCRHIKTNGQRCGSPSLRKEKFCYYHHNNRRPVKRNMAFVRRGHNSIFTIPLIDDRESIQRTIGDVIQAIASDEIDTRRAGLMLYGLQTASHNLPPQAGNPKNPPQRIHTVDQVIEDAVDGLIAPETEWTPDADRPDPARDLLNQWRKEMRSRARQAELIAAIQSAKQGAPDPASPPA